MPAPNTTTVSLFCTLQGAAINYKGRSEELADRFLQALSKLLTKKGIALQPVQTPQEAALQIRFVQIEQGNQLLRYLLPFIAPAFLELEVALATQQGTTEALHYKQTAQVGLFGGSATSMLGVCADRIAKKLSKDLLKRMG